MTHRLSVRAKSKIDAAEIVEYLTGQSVTVAERFIAALEESFAFLQDWPEIANLVDTNQCVR